ncbi:MAG: mechanosensitive ion channel family protein [Gammaproteobacteria bacterium]
MIDFALIGPPWLQAVAGVLLLLLVATIANWVTRRVLIRGLQKVTRLVAEDTAELLIEHRVADRLANAVPALVVLFGIVLVPHLHDSFVVVVQRLAQVMVVVAFVRAVSAALDVANAFYQKRPHANDKPIKGYLQLIKIVLYLVVGLVVVGIFLDRDIFTLLAGLGAMAAVLLLIFQSTILSLVASVQVSSYDMVRVGDWIEMPDLNADGDVIDISLHTVTVQNWDKTITTIPTSRLVTDTFRNWRGMTEAGGRRIKRPLYLDQTSVRFLQDDECKTMRRFYLLGDYLDKKLEEIEAFNHTLAARGAEPVNMRRVTNLGTFRAYVQLYLRNHPQLNQGLTQLVRQLDPTPEGIPLEIYCFTATTAWADYEGVQSDIFDHLLAILPEFGLRVFQNPSGADWRAGLSDQRPPE